MIVQALIDQGVDTVFGYPGGAVLPIYDAIFQQNSIQHVLVRHEQGAVHAAEGYARSTGKPGVCLVTSGPGATNAVTGLTDALLDSIPIVVLTGQVPTFMIGSDAFQEADTVGITRGFMTTIHSYTGDQPTLDRMHKDLYRARAAAANIIPTTTGAARAVGLVLPELDGKLDGTAIRVPSPNVSVIDLTFEAARETSIEEINAAIASAANGPLKGILEYSERPLVSSDYNHHPASSIFAADQTRVLQGSMCRVLSWYDNEWGFANRMVDTAVAMGRLL